MLAGQEQTMAEIGGRIQAVFFDLDETLLDDDRCMREAVARVCGTICARHPQVDPGPLEDAYITMAKEIWTGSGSVPQASGSTASVGSEIRLEVWSRALAKCGLPIRRLAREAVELYGRERQAGYRLFPEVLEVLDALRRRFILGLITNGPGDVQREKLRLTGIEPLLQVTTISGELGVGKPEPGIFLAALEQARVGPEKAAHVGDSLASDVAGAKAAGMYAVWINRRKSARPWEGPGPDVEIETVRDLLPLVTGEQPEGRT